MTSSALMEAILGATAKPEENMYGFIGRTVGQAAPLMMDPYGSRGQNATYALGATLLQGLLGGLGQRRAAEENQMMQSQIARGLKDPSLWGQLAEENPRIASIANAAQLEEATRAQELVRKQLERETDLEWKMREKKELAPFEIESEVAKYKALAPHRLAQTEQEEMLRGKYNPNSRQDSVAKALGVEGYNKLLERKAIAETALKVADVLEKSDQNWAQYIGGQLFAGLDKDQAYAQALQVLDDVQRLRSGAAGTENETERLGRFIKGDKSITPQEAARIMRKFVALDAAQNKAILSGAQLTAPELGAELDNIVARATASNRPSFEQFKAVMGARGGR